MDVEIPMKINLRIKKFLQWHCLVAMVLWNTCALAGNLEEGMAAIEKEDYMTAYQVFKNLAEEGNAEAQHNLAILYKQGKGVMQDSALAFTWFSKAAEQGLADAEYYLGHLYDSGEGVEKNAAVAFNWYSKAAEKGNPLAQTNLGVMYANGEGTRQDIILAYVWFSLAASQGLAPALDNRNVLVKDMSEELRRNAQKLTREYFQKYVAPFQAKPGPRHSGNRHPRLPTAHSGSQESASQEKNSQGTAPKRQAPQAGGHSDKHNHGAGHEPHGSMDGYHKSMH